MSSLNLQIKSIQFNIDFYQFQFLIDFFFSIITIEKEIKLKRSCT